MDRRNFLKLSGAGLVAAAIPQAVATVLDAPAARLIADPTTKDVLVTHNIARFSLGQEYCMEVDANGMTLCDLYSYLKEQFKSDDAALRYPFPMQAITPEYMEMNYADGWTFDGSFERGSLRLNENETLMGMVSLGPDPGAFGGAIDRQDFFARINVDVQPLGKHPFNVPIIVCDHAELSKLEIIDAQERVWSNASGMGITDEYRSGPIYYPIFSPQGYHLDFVDGGQDYVDAVTFWMNRGNTKAEAFALVWPDKYEMPPQQIWPPMEQDPIKRRLS